LYYVGLASDLRWRLAQHLKDHHGQSWDRFSVYLTIGDQHLRELECLILRIVKPVGNKISGNFTKSENLRRRLTKDIKLLQRDQLSEIIGRNSKSKVAHGPINGQNDAPILSPYISLPLKLKAVFKGKTVVAHARRDGSIRFNGAVFNSPSAAGAAAVKRPTCNGWSFWMYERAPGDWVRLSTLRK
jgi:hypothetical protein